MLTVLLLTSFHEVKSKSTSLPLEGFCLSLCSSSVRELEPVDLILQRERSLVLSFASWRRHGTLPLLYDFLQSFPVASLWRKGTNRLKKHEVIYHCDVMYTISNVIIKWNHWGECNFRIRVSYLTLGRLSAPSKDSRNRDFILFNKIKDI